jgi:hypothetical protein
MGDNVTLFWYSLKNLDPKIIVLHCFALFDNPMLPHHLVGSKYYWGITFETQGRTPRIPSLHFFSQNLRPRFPLPFSCQIK